VTDLSIQSLEACYRLPPSAIGGRRRFDAALDMLLGGLLDEKLARLDLPADGILCLRTVYVPVRLRLSETELGMAEAWARAFAAAVGDAVRGRSSATVIWFRTRWELLIDLATGIVTGSRDREWAWRQVLEHRDAGPLSETDALRLWTVALLAEPTAIVPVLVRLAKASVLVSLVPRLMPMQWTALVDAVVARARVETRSEPPFVVVDTSVVPTERRDQERERERIVGRIVARIIDCSTILRATPRPRSLEVSIALCRLAVAEVEPALAHVDAELFQEVAGEVLARVREQWHESSSLSPETAKPQPRMRNTLTKQRPAEAVAVEAIDPRQRVWTEFGGLLFLLGLLDELAIPARLVERLRESGRPLSWFLHQLARKLVPADANDPAALAFAALLPDDVPPSLESEPADEAEAAFLNQMRGEVELALIERLGDVPEAGGDALGFVCLRRAQVVAERGWFELRFAPNLVSTAIRRAALDLDPGFVPWLGVVVKFVYE
jgi:hypothetical protein